MNPVPTLSVDMIDSSATIRIKDLIPMACHASPVTVVGNRICSTAGAAVLENQSLSGNQATDFPSIITQGIQFGL